MNRSYPLASILIPLYNAEEWIADAIQSALAQTWERTEVIVVDDGSTDDSLRIARSIDDDRLRVVSQENRGACAARNRAFELSSGAYIQYLDADDLLAPNKIETQVRRLEASDDLQLAYTRWGTFTDTPDQVEFDSSNRTWQDFEDPIEWFEPWALGKGGMRPHAWLTPRVLVERAGPWKEDLQKNQDGEFFSRVLLHSSGIVFCGDTEVYYRSRGDGVSSRRSPEAWHSLFHSLDLICARILNYENTDRTRRWCATKWEQFRRRVYPDCPDLVRRAKEHRDALGGAAYENETSLAHQLLEALLGWKGATHVKRLYRRIRYSESFSGKAADESQV